MPIISTYINWGSVADWVSGIGSLAAAVVALYVAHSSQRIKLSGYSGHRIIIWPGHPRVDVFAVSATNISQRPTVITNIGLTCGIWRWKKHGIVTFPQDLMSHGIPKPLSDGETGNWNVELGPNNKWAKELVETFKMGWFSIATLRVQVHTSNGGTTTFRPDKAFRKILLSFVGSPNGG